MLHTFTHTHTHYVSPPVFVTLHFHHHLGIPKVIIFHSLFLPCSLLLLFYLHFYIVIWEYRFFRCFCHFLIVFLFLFSSSVCCFVSARAKYIKKKYLLKFKIIVTYAIYLHIIWQAHIYRIFFFQLERDLFIRVWSKWKIRQNEMMCVRKKWETRSAYFCAALETFLSKT